MMKIAAGGLWTAGATLLVMGTLLPDSPYTLEMFAWSMYLGFAAMVLTGYMLVAFLVEREMQRAENCIAEAVGRAIGRHIDGEDDRPRGLRSAR